MHPRPPGSQRAAAQALTGVGERPAVGGACRPASPTVPERWWKARPALPHTFRTPLVPQGESSPLWGQTPPMLRLLASYSAGRGGPAFRVLAGARILPSGERGEEEGRRGAQSPRAYLTGPWHRPWQPDGETAGPEV